MLNTNERIIKHKVGLLNLAEELGNVSKSCQVMGLSRDTFYRFCRTGYNDLQFGVVIGNGYDTVLLSFGNHLGNFIY